MLRVKVVDRSLIMRRTALDFKVPVALHAVFIRGLPQVLRSDMLGVAGGAGWRESLQRLMGRSLMASQASLIGDVLAEADADEAGLYCWCMAGITSFSSK